MQQSNDTTTWARTPGFAKFILALETFIIFFLSFWIYQEYENNQYLQTYINTSLQGTGFTFLAIGSIAGMGLLSIILFRHLRQVQNELQELLSSETVRNTVTHSPHFLDHKAEQHLVDLIRRTQQPKQPVQSSLDG